MKVVPGNGAGGIFPGASESPETIKPPMAV
jgi:hypothetical protein